MAKLKRYWQITGWHSTEKIYQEQIGFGQITENKLKEMLRTLAAKSGLVEREIISSYAKKGTKIHHDFLEVTLVSEKPFTYSCGHNPYVLAEVVVETS